MKRGSLTIMILAAVAGLIASVAVSILHDGLSARARPGALETFLARHAWRLAVPATARAMRNPVPATAENLKDARLHFADHCAVCHANDGSGDALFGRGLYPKPPDLRAAETQSRPDGEIFWIIENGVRFTGMPAFSSHDVNGGHSMNNDSWKLVHFIRHLPQLTPEEKLEMAQNNPKSPADREEEKDENDFLNGGGSKNTAGAQKPGQKPDTVHEKKPDGSSVQP
jgi:mono/diheme cytochrome c family protein